MTITRTTSDNKRKAKGHAGRLAYWRWSDAKPGEWWVEVYAGNPWTHLSLTVRREVLQRLLSIPEGAAIQSMLAIAADRLQGGDR